jgi:hypothetical protein
MTIDRLLKVKTAIKQKRSGDFVTYRFKEYLKEYSERDPNTIDKLKHRELLFDYTNYIRGKNGVL